MNAPRIRLDIDATREKLGQLACGFRIDAAHHSEEFPPGIPN